MAWKRSAPAPYLIAQAVHEQRRCDEASVEGILLDVGKVRRAVERLGCDNLREEEVTLHGQFQGVRPAGRRFEFKRSADGEVIRGEIGPAVADPDIINQRLHQSTSISVLATQVGNGKPRRLVVPEAGP